MAALTWNQPGDHVYEAGLDRGVLYIPGGIGVAWNGLTAIDEQTANSIEPVYFDGVKFNDIVTFGDFNATLKAYTYPDELLVVEGTIEDESGVYLTSQPPTRFHLSYRTKVGDDLNELGDAYKIHILYNLTAVPMQKTYETLSMTPDLIEFQWKLSGIPETVSGFKPTAHIIIDTRKIDRLLLSDIEDILYGDEDSDPRIPPMQGLTAFIQNWDRLIIFDNGDGTWTASTPLDGYISMIDATTFQIDNANAVYLDADTYEVSSTEKNEDDIWQP